MDDLTDLRLRVTPAGTVPVDVRWNGAAGVEVAGLHVDGRVVGSGTAAEPLLLEWSVANPGRVPLGVQAVAVVWTEPASSGVRLLSNGWQSWTRSRLMVLGEDEDPSRHGDAPDLARWIFLGDDARLPAGELRSWSVAVIGTGAPSLLGIGFEGGSRHDGVIRVRRGAAGRVEIAVEAQLGGARLAPGVRRAMHPVRIARDTSAERLLGAWAARAGAVGSARAAGPFLTGWCSWYHYFARIDEAAFLDNLGAADAWPLGVVQLDDGWEPAIGDWLATNAKFPSGLAALASRVRAAGRRPGLWLAPFLVAPDAALAHAHPEWRASLPDGRSPLPGGFNPEWGGLVHALDTTRPDVLRHLERLAAALVAQGWTYLKLDFLYAAALPGRFADPTCTPAERVRAGLAAIRRGAGEQATLLGCGAPLGAAVGLVDAMRIGPDVAPRWEPDGTVPGFDEETPATVNAWRNTLVRSPMHRRLWQNDPDCLMLRRRDTALTASQARAWALAVGASGGLVVVSDDLRALDADARRLFDDVLALARAADAAALAGEPPHAPDALEARLPCRLVGPVGDVALSPDTGKATLTRLRA